MPPCARARVRSVVPSCMGLRLVDASRTPVCSHQGVFGDPKDRVRLVLGHVVVGAFPYVRLGPGRGGQEHLTAGKCQATNKKSRIPRNLAPPPRRGAKEVSPNRVPELHHTSEQPPTRQQSRRRGGTASSARRARMNGEGAAEVIGRWTLAFSSVSIMMNTLFRGSVSRACASSMDFSVARIPGTTSRRWR